MITLLVLYLAAGFLLILLSLPLIGEKIKPNPLYGFRVSQTLEDPGVWYAANRYAGKRLLAAGFSILAASVLLYRIPGLGLDGYALACLAVFSVVLLVGLVQSWRYMKTLVK